MLNVLTNASVGIIGSADGPTAIFVAGAGASIGESGITGLLGYGVVFLGLFLLMVVVIAMGKIMAGKKAEAPAPAESAPVAAPIAAAPAAPAVPAGNLAPGSCGACKLYDTPDRDAAMIMAIVADQMGVPLNQLRFKSIKEVK